MPIPFLLASLVLSSHLSLRKKQPLPLPTSPLLLLCLYLSLSVSVSLTQLPKLSLHGMAHISVSHPPRSPTHRGIHKDHLHYICNQPRCPPANEWIIKMCIYMYIYGSDMAAQNEITRSVIKELI